jgi:GH15 family glucan-1,4-alpha-glucosidase
MGGERNYDYRYGWLRDAALIARALRCTTCMDESCRFFEWIVRVAGVCREDDHIPIVFGVEGERDLTEHTLDHLAGFHGSRPVRVGNDAWTLPAPVGEPRGEELAQARQRHLGGARRR